MKFFLNVLKVIFVTFSFTWLTLQLLSVHIPKSYNYVLNFISDKFDIPYESLILKPVVGRGVNEFDTFLYSDTVYAILLVLALSSVVLGFLIIGKGRSLFERLLLLQAFALPKERENWGKVYDSHTSNPVPFASVRILDGSAKSTVLVSSITDLYGRYRIYSNFKSIKYKIQVIATGYQVYINEISTGKGWKNLTLNIALTKENDKNASFLVSKYASYRHNLYQLLVIYIYVVSVVTFLHILYSLFTHFGAVALINLAAYGFAAPWNTYVLLSRNFAKPGRIIDEKTAKPLAGVLVQVYKGLKQQVSTVSDERGIVRLDLPQGKYHVKFYKQGYNYVEFNRAGLLEISVTDQGLMADNVLLSPDETVPLNPDGTLMNPFG